MSITGGSERGGAMFGRRSKCPPTSVINLAAWVEHHEGNPFRGPQTRTVFLGKVDKRVNLLSGKVVCGAQISHAELCPPLPSTRIVKASYITDTASSCRADPSWRLVVRRVCVWRRIRPRRNSSRRNLRSPTSRRFPRGKFEEAPSAGKERP